VTRVSRSVAVASSALALALAMSGCAPAAPPAAPPAPKAREIQVMMNVWAERQLVLFQSQALEPIPATPFLSFAKPDEWEAVYSSCVYGMGASQPHYLTTDGPQPPSVSSPNQESEYIANVRCSLEYPRPSLKARLRTVKQLEYTFAYYRSTLIPCLRSSGVRVYQVPNAAAFLAGAENGLTAWNPYDDFLAAPTQNAASFSALRAKCPPTPPGLPDSSE
jgi:hypothetical protein